MIRRCCDGCGAAIESEPHRSSTIDRLSGTWQAPSGAKLMFEVTTGREPTWNSGDFCNRCVIAAVKSLEDET